MVLAWNKWDLQTPGRKREFVNETGRRFRHLPFLPLLFTSCVTGEGIGALLDACFRVHEARDSRIPTGVLNRHLDAALERKPPAGRGRRFGKIYYVAQTGSCPPTFTMFVNEPRLFGDSYKRYVEKQIRKLNPFEGSPVRIRLRKSK
jgi:GTP-binding protein